MINRNLPLPRAFYKLQEIYHHHAYEVDGVTPALVWLAIARLYLNNKNRLDKELQDFKFETYEGWGPFIELGLMPEAASTITHRAAGIDITTLITEVASVIRQLVKELEQAPSSAWDVLPCLASFDRRAASLNEIFMNQSLAELMIEMLPAKTGSVWLPFDQSGQLTITALRMGYEVNTASVIQDRAMLRHLLLCIDTGNAEHDKLKNDFMRDSNGRPMVSADFIVANPPFGMKVPTESWGQWEDIGEKRQEVFNRVEAWTAFNLSKRAKKLMLMTTTQSLLFSTGQEQRLREGFIEKNKVSINAIVGLPKGVFSAANIATCLVSMVPGRAETKIWMASIEPKNRIETIETALQDAKPLVLERVETKDSRYVSYDEIRKADYVFLPHRLLKAQMVDDQNAVQIAEVSAVVRPPTPYKHDDGETVLELGIQHLRNERWTPIGQLELNEEKKVNTRPGTNIDTFLQANDVLVSIKGTLGLVGLVSDFYGPVKENDEQKGVKAVVSTSCIALRLNKVAMQRGITPSYLVMYLRSAQGQEQIRNLQVGAAMPHIAVQSLMSKLRIPIPSQKERAEVELSFKKLCDIELEIDRLKNQMRDIQDSRWVIKLA
jgi:type I restriction-modification system DNA methylase subunit